MGHIHILIHLNNTTYLLLQLLLHRLANRATNDSYLVTNISISKYTDPHKHCQRYARLRLQMRGETLRRCHIARFDVQS